MAKYTNISAAPITIIGVKQKVRILPTETKDIPDGMNVDAYIESLIKEKKLERAGNASKVGDSQNPTTRGIFGGSNTQED